MTQRHIDRSFNMRARIGVSLLITGLFGVALTCGIAMYRRNRCGIIRNVGREVQATATVIALNLRQYPLAREADQHPEIDGIKSWTEAPPAIHEAHETLKEAAKALNLITPVYILALRKESAPTVQAAPHQEHANALEFLVSSADSPYWRHQYDYKPWMARSLSGQGGHSTGIYDDQHGDWISGGHPVVDASGTRIGFVQVDRKLNELLQALEREAIIIGFKLLITFGTFFGAIAVILWRMTRAEREMIATANAKTNLLSNISHELRTPLSGILGASREIQEATTIDDCRSSALTLRQSASKLAATIDDFLDLGQLSQSHFKSHITRLDIKSLIDQVIAEVQDQVDDKKNRISFNYSGEPGTKCYSDAVGLRKIAGHLIRNAINHTESGSIEITARAMSRVIAIDVSDTGCGIAPDRLSKIFEVFVQGRSDTDRKVGGTGIGLSLVRMITHQLGGEVTAESQLGRGSTFRVQVPNQGGGNTRGALAAAIEVQTGHERHSSAFRSTRILLVEDNPLNAKIANTILQRAGHEITHAPDGEAAVQAYETGDFDLILMDLQMPVLDGYGAARRIREEERSRRGHIPIIAVTADGAETSRHRALECGMDDWLGKPFTPAELIAKVNEAISLSRAAAK